MKDLLNKILQEEETYNLIFEPGYVLEIQDTKISVGLNNRVGKLDEVQVVGDYFPIENDNGLIVYAGKSKIPFFFPQLKENMPAGSYGTFSYSSADVSDLYDKGTTQQNIDLIIQTCNEFGLDLYETAAVLSNIENENGNNFIPTFNASEKASSVWGDYYGRGFPQLTKEPNYVKFNPILKEHFTNPPDIVENPDALYNRVISTFIAVYGAVNGSFTGISLDDCRTSDGKIDYGFSMEIYLGVGSSKKESQQGRKQSNQRDGEKWEAYLKGL